MRIHRTAIAASLSLALCGAMFAPALAETVSYRADLKGASETPPNTSAGTGSVGAQYDTVSKKLSWTVTYTGLTGPAIMAHFHGPADVGVAAGVMVPIKGDVMSPINGEAVLTDDQSKALQDGKMYFNVHTNAFKAGEIRGQMIPASK